MPNLDTQKIHVGTLRVFIDGQPAGTTEGPPKIEYIKETSDVHTNEFGLVDKNIVDNGAEVTISFAQFEPAVLALAIPEANVVTSGTRTALYVSSARGLSLLSLAKQLVLSGTNGTTSQQWTFRKAFVAENFEIEYADEQAPIEVKFTVVPDPAHLTSVDSLVKYETFPTV